MSGRTLIGALALVVLGLLAWELRLVLLVLFGAVVLAVGAKFSGQASAATPTSRWTEAAVASAEAGLPVSATTGMPRRRNVGTSAKTSAVSPLFDKAMTPSSRVIMPRSPWLASVAWTKRAGWPVEAMVAAIFRATCPDLPTPVHTTRPSAAAMQSTTAAKGPSRLALICRRAAP